MCLSQLSARVEIATRRLVNIKQEDHDNQEYHHDNDEDDMPGMYHRDEEESDSDSDNEDESDDDKDSSDDDGDEISQDGEECVSDKDDPEESEKIPTHRHNLRRNPKPSYKYRYGMNATMLGEVN